MRYGPLRNLWPPAHLNPDHLWIEACFHQCRAAVAARLLLGVERRVCRAAGVGVALVQMLVGRPVASTIAIQKAIQTTKRTAQQRHLQLRLQGTTRAQSAWLRVMHLIPCVPHSSCL